LTITPSPWGTLVGDVIAQPAGVADAREYVGAVGHALIAPYYMGDYIANVSDGRRQYFAWGDNRDRVRNWLYPNGRHDPNVYFARR